MRSLTTINAATIPGFPHQRLPLPKYDPGSWASTWRSYRMATAGGRAKGCRDPPDIALERKRPEEIIAAAPGLGIHTLTLFALSSANWQRPAPKWKEYWATARIFAGGNIALHGRRGALNVIGRRDRLPVNLRQAICDAEAATAVATRLHLRLAIDYSAREAIYCAACRFYKATEFPRRHSERCWWSFSRVDDRCGLADSHRWRATAFRFFIVGVCVRGNGVLAKTLAGFYCGRFASGGAGILQAGTNARRAAGYSWG